MCCGGSNKVIEKDSLEHTTCEAETECKVCGFTSYWAYGYYSREKSDWEEVQKIRKEKGITKTDW